MTKFLREAQEKNIHFLVMRHAEPVVCVSPVRKARRSALEQLEKDIALARKHVKEGKVYSIEEVEKILGL